MRFKKTVDGNEGDLMSDSTKKRPANMTENKKDSIEELSRT